MLRARRSTKYRSIAVLSLGNALLMPAEALAGDCTPGPNVVCSGPAAPGTDATQVFNPAGALSIRSSDAILGGTNLGSTAEGLYITNNATATGGISIDVNSITGAGDGIFFYSEGTGDISARASGTITSLTGDGVRISSNSTTAGSLSIDGADVFSSATGVGRGISVKAS